MASRIKWLATSRMGNVLVLSSGLLGYGLYDRYEATQVKTRLQAQVKHLSEEPLAPFDSPRKLTLFVPSTQWADYWFKEFAKPGAFTPGNSIGMLTIRTVTALDAAAIDYDVVKISEPEDLKTKVRTMVWDGKEAYVQGKVVKPPRRTWLQWLLGMPVPQPEEINYGENYHPDQGLVALSLPLWNSLLQGLQEGALGSRHVPVPAIELQPPSTTDKEVGETEGEIAIAKPTDAAVEAVPEEIKKESEDEVETKELPPPITLSRDNLPDGFPLPPLGFLPGDKELPFRTRIFGFFHRRVTSDEVGSAALKIALGKTVPAALSPVHADKMEKEAEVPTTSSLREDIASEVDVYV